MGDQVLFHHIINLNVEYAHKEIFLLKIEIKLCFFFFIVCIS